MQQNELMHRSHKYISRKWKNGRWVYEYYNPEYEKAKNERKNAASNETKKMLQYTASNTNLTINRDIALEDGKVTKDEAKQYVENSMRLEKSLDEYKKAGERYVKAKKEYTKMNIKTLPSRLIGKGAAAVANIVSKASSSISNKKKKSNKNISYSPPKITVYGKKKNKGIKITRPTITVYGKNKTK